MDTPQYIPKDIARFWAKVKFRIMPDQCWEWAASKFKNDYGKFRHSGKTLYTHRVSWELTNGAIPDGLCVLHECDNPACVNPSHLFLGTQLDNIRDRHNKKRDVDWYGIRHGSNAKRFGY